MRKRKRFSRGASSPPLAALTFVALLWLSLLLGSAFGLLLLMESNCLSGTPNCNCSWKGGKFVANCSSQSLSQVPKNDYFDYLVANAGNNQMPTLNRDIQQLSLASNNISRLASGEFYEKKFRNLQKIYLNTNQLLRIHSSAFYKMTGLIELDLSENLISSLYDEPGGDDDAQPSGDFATVSNERGDKIGDQARKHSSRGQPADGRNHQVSSKKSFLQDLTQLRHLNLASNLLGTIEKFTFSPLTQLRQLILSRNRITYIDKRAFDGLDVLNILHLDGNKLSHLDGELLLRLPQLHAIQLAGSNPWRCDCKLRKLVRSLLPRPGERGAPNLQAPLKNRHQTAGPAELSQAGELQRANILQDEPSCEPSLVREPGSQHQWTVSGSGGQDQAEGDGDSSIVSIASKMSAPQSSPSQSAPKRLWKSMKLAEFECPPRLAHQFMVQAPAQILTPNSRIGAEPVTSPADYGQALLAAGGSADRWTVGSPRGAAKDDEAQLEEAIDGRPAGSALVYRQHYLAGEPLELTCASSLTDELDLEQVQLEWWQVDQQHARATLLWRSTPNPAQGEPASPGGQQAGKTRPQQQQQQRQDYAIIDYVTRANGSSKWRAEREEMDETEPGRLSVIRVSHLVVAAQEAVDAEPDASASRRIERRRPQRAAGRDQMDKSGPSSSSSKLFLCRITNSAGHLDLLYWALVDSANREAQLESRRRAALRRQLLEQAEPDSGALSAVWSMNASGGAWPLDRAQAAVASALLHHATDRQANQSANNQPLFVPLHLPEGLAPRWTPLGRRGGGDEAPEVGGSVARSLSAAPPAVDHQRPATRHTNLTLSAAGPSPSNLTGRPLGSGARPAGDDVSAGLLQPADSSLAQSGLGAQQKATSGNRTEAWGGSKRSSALEFVALSLIGRYTSNRRSLLLAGDSHSDEQLALGGGGGGGHLGAPKDDWILGGVNQAGSSSHRSQGGLYEAKEEHLAGSIRSLLLSTYRRHLDRWVQLAIGEAPLLLGVCAGLLVGCLVTSLLVIRMRCANNRVRSTSSSHLSANRKGSKAPSPALDISPGDQHAQDDLERGDSSPESGLGCLNSDSNKQVAGSSSSTTNGSQQKLIRDPPAPIGLYQMNPHELSNQHLDRFLMGDSSCQSEEGEMSGLMDADLDSLTSHTCGGGGGGGSRIRPMPLKSYLTLRPNWRSQQQGRGGGGGDGSGSSGSLRAAGERRLIVLGPQQELVALPESPYCLEATLQHHLIGPGALASQLDLNESLSAESNSASPYDYNRLRQSQQHVPDAPRQNLQAQAGSHTLRNQPQWPEACGELADGGLASTLENSPSSVTMVSDASGQLQQFIMDSSHQQLPSHNQKQSHDLVDRRTDGRDDSFLMSPNYLDIDSCGLISGGQLLAGSACAPLAGHAFPVNQMPPTLRRPQATTAQDERRQLQQQQQAIYYLQPTSSSSVASPIPSTSSSLTMCSNNNAQINHQCAGGGPLLVRDFSSRSDPSEDTSSQNPNIVYLEDALQLLQSSMKDCVLLDESGLDNRRRV